MSVRMINDGNGIRIFILNVDTFTAGDGAKTRSRIGVFVELFVHGESLTCTYKLLYMS